MDYPIRTPEQLGQVLKGFRGERHLTQAQLGLRTGLAQNAISELEREAAKASLRRLFRVLSALGVELVMRDTQSPPPAPPKGRSRPSPEW